MILYKTGIEQLIAEASEAGYKTVALVGKSDLDFIVEYACGKVGLGFIRFSDDKWVSEGYFVIYSEQLEINDKNAEKRWLRNVV